MMISPPLFPKGHYYLNIKYREIDSFGQNAIQAVLDAEYERIATKLK